MKSKDFLHTFGIARKSDPAQCYKRDLHCGQLNKAENPMDKFVHEIERFEKHRSTGTDSQDRAKLYYVLR